MKIHHLLLHMFAIVGCWFLLASSHASVIIDGFTATEHDRFKNDSSYLLNAHDVSGVAISEGEKRSGTHWATLVSNNVVLSANHYHPGGETVAFYDGNNPESTPVVRTVSTGQRVQNTDLWMGVLNNPVPSNITSYTYADETLTNATAGSSTYALKNAYLFGKSPSSDYGDYKTTDIATGRNVLDFFDDSPTFGSSTGAAWGAVYNDSTHGNYVDSETFLQTGDSSGPMFVEKDGALKLVGINWAIGQLSSGEDISLMTYVGNYSDTINNYIQANAIPEPTTVCLLLLGGACVLLRRRGQPSLP